MKTIFYRTIEMGSSKDRMGFRMEFRMVLRYRKIGISRWDSKMEI